MKNFSNNEFSAYLLILLSFFILLFFTKAQYESLQQNLDTQTQTTQELDTKSKELEKLNALKNELANDESQAQEEIASISKGYDDSRILEYIYSYAQKVNLGQERLIIRGLSMNDGGESDLGFKRLDLSVSVITSSEATLFAFLNHLTSGEGAFTFYQTEFSYPEQKVGNVQVDIPLILYYQ